MAQGEECVALIDVKDRQNKLDTRMNEHGERIAKIEVVINDVLIPELKEVKEITKRSEQSINSSSLKAAESAIQLSNLSSKMDGIILNQQKPSLGTRIFEDTVKTVITLLFLSLIVLAVTQTKFFQ